MTTMALVTVLAEVFVTGHPKTKGSLEVVTTKHVREKPGSSRWRALVADRLRADMLGRDIWAEVSAEGLAGPYAGRVGVLIVSYLQPPARRVPMTAQEVREWLCGQYSSDVDKLARNVLDAAVDAGVIVDDGQVVDLYSHKRLAREGMMPGQRIQIWITPEGHEW